MNSKDEDSASMGKGVVTDMYVEEMAGDDAPIPISQFDDSIAKSKNADNSIEKMFDGDGDAPMPHSLVGAAASSKAKRFGLEHIASDANAAPIPPQYLEGTMDKKDSRKKVDSTRQSHRLAPSAPRVSQPSSSSVRNGSNSEQGTTDTIEVLEATLVQEPPLYNAVQVEEQREQENPQPPSESANQYQTWWKKHSRCVFVGLVFIIGGMAAAIAMLVGGTGGDDAAVFSPNPTALAATTPSMMPIIQLRNSQKPTTTLKPVTSPPTTKPTLKPVTSPPTTTSLLTTPSPSLLPSTKIPTSLPTKLLLPCEEEISAGIQLLEGVPKLTVSDSSLVKVDVDGIDMVVLTKDADSGTIYLRFYELQDDIWVYKTPYRSDGNIHQTPYQGTDATVAIFGGTTTVGLPCFNALNCAGGTVKLYEKKGTLGWQQQHYHESYDLGWFTHMGKTLDGDGNAFVVTARNLLGNPQIYYFKRLEAGGTDTNFAFLDWTNCCSNIMETNVSGDTLVATADDRYIHSYKFNNKGQLEVARDPIPTADKIIGTSLSSNYLVYITQSTVAGIRSYTIHIYHRWNTSHPFVTKIGRLELEYDWVEMDLDWDVLLVAPAQTNEVHVYKLDDDIMGDPVVVTLERDWPSSNYHNRASNGNAVTVDGRRQLISYFNIDGCF